MTASLTAGETSPAGTHRSPGKLADRLFVGAARLAAVIVVLALIGILISLAHGAWPALHQFGLSFLWTEQWNPAKDLYGAATPVFGTLVSSLIAMAIAVPLSFGIAIFLTELCPNVLRRPIGIAIELLAGIPSIIYGLWGFFVFARIMQTQVEPFLNTVFGPIPGLNLLLTGAPYGVGLLTAGIVLAFMALPFITAITRDVFETVPAMLRESAYGMGMTRWEVVRNIVIPYCRRGLVGGVMLGLGRALGETMAVTFVIGNSHRIAASLLSPSTTISSAIANEFQEATTPLYTSSLIALGFILTVISFIVLGLARWMIARTDHS